MAAAAAVLVQLGEGSREAWDSLRAVVRQVWAVVVEELVRAARRGQGLSRPARPASRGRRG